MTYFELMEQRTRPASTPAFCPCDVVEFEAVDVAAMQGIEVKEREMTSAEWALYNAA